MFLDTDKHGFFRLDDEFVEPYRARAVQWGFGDLSYVTFKRSYSREGEQWWQTCRRVVEGMFTIQLIHCRHFGLPWDWVQAERLARDAYERLWRFKWTPPGRGLWLMGTRFMYERGGAGLNNCGFVSTRDVDVDYAAPFLWMLNMSMLGVGVGFDTRGKGKVTLAQPRRGQDAHVIGDSREGWAEALSRLLNAYVGRGNLPASWDYSQIRPAGAKLLSFGGYASGPGPLRQMIESLEALHDGYAGKAIDARLIVDAMNMVGRCIVAGGIRRSAQIAFGSPGDAQFLDLKSDAAKVVEYRWVSNNSIFAEVGMDYGEAVRRTADNGEPGYLWLANARGYGRMKDPPNDDDAAAEGSNPCVEQTLWDRELCCLVETYPANHGSLEDYLRTLRVAYLYAKTVTLAPVADERTAAVMARNRRIGCSMTGIVQAIGKLGYRRFLNWADRGYGYLGQLDRRYSAWLCVPRSIKLTSVKPSGTVSILAGATPGVHWDHAPCYLRRVRVAKTHPLADMCRRAGYPVEDDRYSSNTIVVGFPVKIGHVQRRKTDVPIREKVDLAVQMQRYWSDNQVSCTVDFDPDREADQVAGILEAYEDRLKSISFLPARRHGYPQPPYEEIDESKYRELTATIKPIRGDLAHEEALEERYCEGGVCELPEFADGAGC